MTIPTPKSSRDLKSIQKVLEQTSNAFKTPTARFMFWKVARALDVATGSKAAAAKENDELRAQLQDLRSKKRKKVTLNPNDQFVDIQRVLEVRAQPNQRKRRSRRRVIPDSDQENV
ncbi:hypothetical protein F4861DRAFT_539274 [Xylaria intraflava]|nr:hypothetical protein F4861DRAFT_539274 [Xylaria intraflava]